MATLQQLLTDLQALAADPNLPASADAIKAIASHPDFARVMALVKAIEADPPLVAVLQDLTPSRQQIITALAALTPPVAPAA